MDTSFFHTKFPTTSRAEGAVSSANTGMLPFTGSSQLQQQQTSNYPRPPRATDDPSRHSTVSAAPVGGRPDLATVETTARGPLHPLRGAAPDQKGCTAYGSGAAPRITRTNAESARREPGCGARGRRQGLAGQRVDAPSETRGADGSRAGRRPRARQAARPSTAAQPQLSRHSTSHRHGHPRR